MASVRLSYGITTARWTAEVQERSELHAPAAVDMNQHHHHTRVFEIPRLMQLTSAEVKYLIC